MKTFRRILALAGVFLLLGLYALTFLFSLLRTENADALFKASLAMTILVPVLLYAILLTARVLAPSSPVFDALILSGSWDSEEEEAIRLYLSGLTKRPLKTFCQMGADPDSLSSLLSENHLVRDRVLVIDSNADRAALFKKKGFAAAACGDLDAVKKELRRTSIAR